MWVDCFAEPFHSLIIISQQNLRYKARDSPGSGPTIKFSPHHLANPSRMSTALARVSLLVVATTLQSLSVVPPTPTPDDAHQDRFHKSIGASASPDRNTDRPRGGSRPKGWTRPKYDQMGSRITSVYLPYAFAASCWILVMLEIPRSFGHEDPLNRRFVLGTLLTILGSLLRWSSFGSLGRYFTYQLAILPSHALVTTGPYAYIRHPSYVAVPIAGFGWTWSSTSQGMVLREWFGESNVDGVVLAEMIGMLYICWQFTKRAEAEDEVLKEEFGKEWEEWARVVKYRFIPGLY